LRKLPRYRTGGNCRRSPQCASALRCGSRGAHVSIRQVRWADSTHVGHPPGAGITFCHTGGMAKAISVRLDDDAERALRALEASGLSRSEAIRASLLASAQRLRRGKDLAAEAAALEADEDDRA